VNNVIAVTFVGILSTLTGYLVLTTFLPI
jgi:hypothetical protein